MICFLVFTDPYLNTDAGTMSPFEHGEVFVLDDGGEVLFSFFLYAILSSNYVTTIGKQIPVIDVYLAQFV